MPILTDWTTEFESHFGRRSLNLGHDLHNHALFTDEALAELIERTPRNDYHVNTMDAKTHDPRTRREGEINGLSGKQTLDAIGSGLIWLNLRNPGEHVPAYAELLEQIYEELHERVSDFKTFKRRMTILISSPKVQVYYHADVPGQSLWQVRGTKRVWVYPNQPPFLPQDGIERIVLGEAHEISLPYEKWFDDHAEVVDLEAGRMVHWPINCPHRVVNHDCLNISVTTEHWTKELRNIYATNYANGILRKHLGFKNLSQSTSGASLYGKLGLAALYKFSGLERQRAAGFNIDFKVDPKAPNSVADIQPYELRK